MRSARRSAGRRACSTCTPTPTTTARCSPSSARDEQLVDALLDGIAVARERIDLRRHDGAHPRIGAADIVPLVPIRPGDMPRRARRRWRSRRGSPPSSGCRCSSTASSPPGAGLPSSAAAARPAPAQDRRRRAAARLRAVAARPRSRWRARRRAPAARRAERQSARPARHRAGRSPPSSARPAAASPEFARSVSNCRARGWCRSA